jgi:hypothetical protein
MRAARPAATVQTVPRGRASLPAPAALAVLALLTLLAAALAARPADAQCILANPSFEMPGSGGAVFQGWNQFGPVGSTTVTTHGFRAASAVGANLGGWDLSGYWQPLTCAPGERWRITGHARHPSGRPLTGQCAGLVNVEWRDAAGTLLSYDSFSVVTAATPVDRYVDFDLTSSAAPAGTATARLVVGVLQAPGAPVPEAWFDQVTFDSLTPPTQADRQWVDFPSNRVIAFGGRNWRVKGSGWFGPGNNYFSHLPDRCWVDTNGWLHLTLKNYSGTWNATEVTAVDALGYGDYVLTTRGRLDLVDPQAVLGIFLWEYGPCYDDGYLWWNPYNEIDIEYSRWGNPADGIGQFVAQPYWYAGNIQRFNATFGDGEVTSHALRWLPNKVEIRAWRGGPADESPATLIYTWTYTGPHIPRPEAPRLHLNLWKLGGTPAANQEVVFTGFHFYPVGAVADVAGGAARGVPGAPEGRLLDAAPNPFNPRTTLRFELDRPGDVRLEIYDLAGNRVRSLVAARLEAGAHEAEWDGRDERGLGLASGVYLVQLRGTRFAESRPVTLLR